jgi:hypothetical protein
MVDELDSFISKELSEEDLKAIAGGSPEYDCGQSGANVCRALNDALTEAFCQTKEQNRDGSFCLVRLRSYHDGEDIRTNRLL